MADDTRRAAFLEKYPDGAKVWSGATFTGYLNLRSLLEELPTSEVAVSSREYARQSAGIADNIYGELIHHLLAYEGYLRDKAYPIRECLIKPVIEDLSCRYQFIISYATKEGEERNRTYEVARSDERNFIYYADPLKS